MGHFLFDLLLLAFLCLCLVSLTRPAGLPVQLLRSGIFGILLIGAWATFLGYAGWLHPFALTGGLVLSALLLWRRVRAPGERLKDWIEKEAKAFRAQITLGRWTRAELILALPLVLFLLTTLVSAAGQTPVINDSLCYRLSRIGWWLQEGNLWQTDLIDSRLNFMPPLADLQMLWVTGHWFEGYPGTALPQWAGGMMLLLSGYVLVRAEGGSRRSGLLAAWLLAGMPLVAAEFSTDQTDLFTAGLFATGLALFRSGLGSGRLDSWAALSFGLSLAAKPSVAFALPGLVIWAGWMWWSRARPTASIARFLACGIIPLGFIAGPRMVENRLRYGSFVSSPEVAADYLRPELTAKGFWLNVKTSAVQLATPGPLPDVLHGPLSDWMAGKANVLPEEDPDQVPGESRRKRLQTVGRFHTYDADASPPGPAMTLAPLFVLVLGGMAWRGSTPSQRAAIWGGLLASFSFAVIFLLFNRWHPYWFRFLSLPACWLAVSTALAADRSGRMGTVCGWGLCGLSTVTAFLTWGFCAQSGLNNLMTASARDPEAAMTRLATSIAMQTDQDPAVSLTLLLPYNSLMAGYFRTDAFTRVLFAPSAAWSDPKLTPARLAGPAGGWVVTTPERFRGVPAEGPAAGAGLGYTKFKARDLAVYLTGPGVPPPRPWLRHASIEVLEDGKAALFEVVSPTPGRIRFVVQNRNSQPVLLVGVPGKDPVRLAEGQSCSGDAEISPHQPFPLSFRFLPADPTAPPPQLPPSVSFSETVQFMTPPAD